MRYHPLHPPAPRQWLDLDEDERLELVQAHHAREQTAPPGAGAHAAIHVMVENQIAMGEETPVAAVVARLTAEGLDRHEAIHAVGSALAAALTEAMKPDAAVDDITGLYYAGLVRLTAESWRRDFD